MSLANATQAHRESLQRQTQEAFAIVILSLLIPLKIVDDLSFCLKVLEYSFDSSRRITYTYPSTNSINWWELVLFLKLVQTSFLKCGQCLKADWVNREYIELITGSIKRIADFLNSFDMSCRSKRWFEIDKSGQPNSIRNRVLKPTRFETAPPPEILMKAG